jgi:hypothetical protein
MGMFSDFLTYSQVAGLLSGLASFLFFGWMAFQTRSWYILKYFLWRMFHGKGGMSDPVIRRYLGEQSSLMLFRFVAVDAETNQDAKDLIKWSNEKNIGLETVGRAGSYFDPKSRAIYKKKVPCLNRYKAWFVTLAVLPIVIMMPVLLSFATSRAIVSLKVSGQWFLLGQDSVKALFLFHNADELSKSQCAQPGHGDINKTGFTQAEVDIICRFWPDAATAAYVDKTVHEQRVAGIWFLLILGVFSFSMSRSAGAANAAIRVHDRLANHDKTSEGSEPSQQ